MAKIHENVERIREAKGVTKTYVARKLGVSLMAYSHMAAGRVSLSAERLKVIADALDVPVQVFFDDELTESVIKRFSMPGSNYTTMR